jgi:hypothetical protein
MSILKDITDPKSKVKRRQTLMGMDIKALHRFRDELRQKRDELLSGKHDVITHIIQLEKHIGSIHQEKYSNNDTSDMIPTMHVKCRECGCLSVVRVGVSKAECVSCWAKLFDTKENKIVKEKGNPTAECVMCRMVNTFSDGAVFLKCIHCEAGMYLHDREE